MKWWTESGPIRLPEQTPLKARLRLVTTGEYAASSTSSDRPVASAAESTGAMRGAVESMPRSRRTLWQWARDLTIGASLLVALPVAVIGVVFNSVPHIGHVAEQRLNEIEPLRVLRAVQDPTITPLSAGEALARITDVSLGEKQSTRFATASKAQRSGITPAESSLFLTIRDPQRQNALDYSKLITAASQPISGAEAAWLERMASLPLWRDADLVASANRIDVIAGRFTLPLRDNAGLWDVPVTDMSAWRQLAHAGVARAAWYVHQGDYVAADAALRTVVSLGFALVDNGPVVIEGLIGRAAVQIGRQGFAQLAQVRGDAALQRLVTAPERPVGTPRDVPINPMGDRPNADVLLAGLTDSRLPFSARMERRFLLSYLPCMSVRGVLFGPSETHETRLAEADGQLARFPSERQLIATHETQFERLPTQLHTDGAGRWLLGVAHVATAVTGNPRIAGCMVPIVARW